MAVTAKMCACGRELALCSQCIAELVEGQKPIAQKPLKGARMISEIDYGDSIELITHSTLIAKINELIRAQNAMGLGTTHRKVKGK